MKFGEWLRELRLNRGYDARFLADTTGVDSSTISRTENLQTETSVYTAYKICEGLGVTAFDLIKELNEQPAQQFLPLLLESSSISKKNKILTLEDIDRSVKDYTADRQHATNELVYQLNDLLNILVKDRRTRRYREYNIPVSPNDIQRFLLRTPLFQRLEIDYPMLIDHDMILETYKRKGALMIADVETYVQRLRNKRNHPLKTEAHLPLGSLRMSGRMGTGSILERTPLSDVIDFDTVYEQEGAIIGMYWEACRFYDRFSFSQRRDQYEQLSLFGPGTSNSQSSEREDWMIRLAMLNLTVYRWNQYLRWNELQMVIE